MESNNEIKNELPEEAVTESNADMTEITLPEGRSNLEICPNCLEPNPDDLAVCSYCGQPLHPGAEAAADAMPESEAELAAARAEAAQAEKKPAEKKKQENGFRRVMPWLGLYLIYYAITGIIETSRQKELENPKLAYFSWVVYMVAGILMAWPLIKKGWNKIHPTAPAQEENTDAEEVTADEETAEEASAGEESNVTEEEETPENEADFTAEEPAAEEAQDESDDERPEE